MKYTINKNQWNHFYLFISLILIIFCGLIILVNKKFLFKIDTLILKNYPYYIIKNPLYYSNLDYKNIIIYDSKSIMAIPTGQKYNKYNQVILSNGIKGWIKIKNIKSLYNWTIAQKNNHSYKFYKIISIHLVNNFYILLLIDENFWPKKSIKLFIHKDKFTQLFF